jgi:hypothetical protein
MAKPYRSWVNEVQAFSGARAVQIRPTDDDGYFSERVAETYDEGATMLRDPRQSLFVRRVPTNCRLRAGSAPWRICAPDGLRSRDLRLDRAMRTPDSSTGAYAVVAGAEAPGTALVRVVPCPQRDSNPCFRLERAAS